MAKTKLEILAKTISPLVEISTQDLKDSLHYWRFAKFSPKEAFNHRGSIYTHFGIVINGSFRIYAENLDKNIDHTLFFIREGDFFVSFRDLNAPTAYTFDIKALGASEILYISHDNLEVLYQRSAAWAKFGRIIESKSKDMFIAKLLFYKILSAKERYLQLEKSCPDILQWIKQKDIASFIGVTQSTLSKILKKLGGGRRG